MLLDWGTGITARENMYIVSIPSLFDPTLAPPGKHVVHIYAAANEPFAAWEGMDRKSKEYAEAKAAAMAPLWQALELIIPDIRERTEVSLDATPLTHERFTRRYKGTYGPSGGKEEGDLDFLGPSTPFAPNLKLCGDSCFPGIGTPSAAASGAICANTMNSVDEHMKLLKETSKFDPLYSFLDPGLVGDIYMPLVSGNTPSQELREDAFVNAPAAAASAE